MLSAMIGMPCARSSSAARADVAAHDRAGQDEQPGPRQVGDGPDRRRDVVLADERDRVDADPLAAEVVPIGLAHRAERDLGDLRPAADHDHALAEHPVEAAGRGPGCAAPAGREPSALRTSSASPSTSTSISTAGRSRRPTHDRRSSRRTRAGGRCSGCAACRQPPRRADQGREDRRGVVKGEPDGDGRRAGRAAVAATGHRRAGSASISRRSRPSGRRRPRSCAPGARPAAGSCSSKARPRAAKASRVAAGVTGREHERAVGVLRDADDAGDVDAAVAERRLPPGRANPADPRAGP